MTYKDIIDKIVELRLLVEEVHDVSFITLEDSQIVERTNEGRKLARVLFGLDIIRHGIKEEDYDIRTSNDKGLT